MKRLAKLCTKRYIIKGARNGENIFCDKIDNIPRKWRCKEYKKRKLGKQIGKPERRFTKYKRFRKEWRKPFKKHYKKIFNYKIRNITQNTSKEKSKCKFWKCGELGHYSNECQKEKKKTFIIWRENKEDDLESILSFDS